MLKPLYEKLFSVTDSNFEEMALHVFNFQFEEAEVYREFCTALKRTPATVHRLADVPFLPVEFFKTHRVIAKSKQAAEVFESSGTTGSVPSKHYVADRELYEQSFVQCFEHFYGAANDYVILALLPSYLERENSSLVYMANQLIALTGKVDSGFFLNEYEKLHALLLALKIRKQKTVLLGVTFALLDFAEKYRLSFPELTVMETGGMKGRREELTRAEVHEKLCRAFNVKHIHSEYGMTELLSQAYSKGDGVFRTPPWMKILLRDVTDPLSIEGRSSGAVNVIDLANLYSCSFIATSDMGKLNTDGSFEISGRLDNAEVRGCNLMVAKI